VPKALGGGGAGLSQARKAISAIAKGEPTALILVMQYLQHTRLQDSKTWPSTCASAWPRMRCATVH
jgi:hypothetical protein